MNERETHGSDVRTASRVAEVGSARARRRTASGRRAGRSAGPPRGLRRRLAELSPAKRVAIVAPTLLVALLLAVLGVEAAASVGRIHPGVRVAGVPVGGRTPAGAAEVLESAIGTRMDDPVLVAFEDQSWSVEATHVAAAPQIEDMTEAAMAVGRTGDPWTRVKERASAWLAPVELPPLVAADPEALRSLVATIDAQVSRPPQDATVIIDGTTARIEPAVVGVAMRLADVANMLLESFASETRQVSVPVDFVPVQVTDADAQQALEDAQMMMSGPVTVTYDDAQWEFAADEIAHWIKFRPIPAAEDTASPLGAAAASQSASAEGSSASGETTGTPRLVLEAFIDSNAASATVTAKVGEAGRPPADAQFKVGGGSVTIIPSQDGVGPDVEALARELTQTLTSGGPRTVELRTMRVAPERTTADAEAMGIKERISTYTTHFDSGNKPRVNNIHTLADALDGTLIPPGGTFSFNETIGPRTAAKGYQEAPAIVNGKLVPQLGGGICQVGTTIFNTIFESGLPVLERRNHSFYISHYPTGRDATVSWGGPDFKFKNDTDNWVLIATGYSSSSLTISLYGTDPGYEVSASVGAWTNIKPHPVSETKDPTLALGTRVVEDAGVDGRTIVVTRTVKKGGTVLRTDSFTSVYKPKEEVARVGTMPVSVPETTSATP